MSTRCSASRANVWLAVLSMSWAGAAALECAAPGLGRRHLAFRHAVVPSARRGRTRPTTTSLRSTGTFRTLEGDDIHAAEEVVKKSRFIGYACHCTDWADAQSILETVRSEHPKSRHVAYGFVSSAGAGTERASDDGEPTGTAGSPILGAIRGEGLSDVVCAVVRYFGGVKLGAGGLIRAYGGAARLVLRESPTVVCTPRTAVRVATGPADSGSVYSVAARFGGTAGEESYTDGGDLEVTIACEEEVAGRLRQALVDATKGGVVFVES